jgi:hypothetical protein
LDTGFAFFVAGFRFRSAMQSPAGPIARFLLKCGR